MFKSLIRHMVPDYLLEMCDHTVNGEKLFEWTQVIDYEEWLYSGDYVGLFLWATANREKIIIFANSAHYYECNKCISDVDLFLNMLQHATDKIRLQIFKPSTDFKEDKLKILPCNIL